MFKHLYYLTLGATVSSLLLGVYALNTNSTNLVIYLSWLVSSLLLSCGLYLMDTVLSYKD